MPVCRVRCTCILVLGFFLVGFGFFSIFTKYLDSKRAVWALNLTAGSWCPVEPEQAKVQKGSCWLAGEKTRVRFLAVVLW